MSRRLGNFELVKRVGRSGTVWAGRRDGERGAYAIKVYEPPSDLDPGAVTEAIRRRLAAAEWQKKAGSSPYWAKVFDVGAVDPAGVYCATELFGWSADQLIEEGVGVGPAGLGAIIGAVVAGVLDYRAATGLWHGNIKPANVLISERGPAAAVPGKRVALTDPSGDEVLGTDAGEDRDRQALGRLIFELVTLKPFTSGDWPVKRTAAWAGLGEDTEIWLQRCNELLGPRSATIDGTVSGLAGNLGLRVPHQQPPPPQPDAPAGSAIQEAMRQAILKQRVEQQRRELAERVGFPGLSEMPAGESSTDPPPPPPPPPTPPSTPPSTPTPEAEAASPSPEAVRQAVLQQRVEQQRRELAERVGLTGLIVPPAGERSTGRGAGPGGGGRRLVFAGVAAAVMVAAGVGVWMSVSRGKTPVASAPVVHPTVDEQSRMRDEVSRARAELAAKDLAGADGAELTARIEKVAAAAADARSEEAVRAVSADLASIRGEIQNLAAKPVVTPKPPPSLTTTPTTPPPTPTTTKPDEWLAKAQEESDALRRVADQARESLGVTLAPVGAPSASMGDAERAAFSEAVEQSRTKLAGLVRDAVRAKLSDPDVLAAWDRTHAAKAYSADELRRTAGDLTRYAGVQEQFARLPAGTGEGLPAAFTDAVKTWWARRWKTAWNAEGAAAGASAGAALPQSVAQKMAEAGRAVDAAKAACAELAKALNDADRAPPTSPKALDDLAGRARDAARAVGVDGATWDGGPLATSAARVRAKIAKANEDPLGHLRTAANDADLAELKRYLAKTNKTAADLKLSSETRFNLTLYDARQDIRRADTKAEDVLERLRAAKPPGADVVLPPPRPPAPPPVAGKFVPPVPRANGWRVTPAPAAEGAAPRQIDLDDPASGEKIQLLHVATDRCELYVQSTEMSVGQFAAIFNENGNRVGLLPGFDPPAQGRDVWFGPRAYRIDSSGRMVPNDQWCIGALGNALNVGPPPSKRSPMNAVSYADARALAAFMGCRLLTAQDWRDAVGDPKNKGEPLLHTEQWETFRKRMENDPHVGDALRVRAQMSDSIAPDASESPTVRGDGLGWFRSVPAVDDGVLHDLVGNVAEFVTSENEVRIIGGSAISAKDQGAEGVVLPLGRNGVARKFSDVGFRVAYSVAKLTADPATRAPNRDETIREAINQLNYLSPDAPKSRAQ